ncbi:hypothetical protein ACWDRB_60770 [Nonomuraea sp. NPDC003707]
MQNRPALAMMISLGGHLDARLQSVGPEFVDWVINVGDQGTARIGCEIAWRLAHAERYPGASGLFGLLNLALSEVPQLLETFRSARA